MNSDQQMNQPTLFEPKTADADAEKVILYALGEFQNRGFTLAGRELALDRLRGAFKRAAEIHGFEEFSDEKLAEVLKNIGAEVKKVPAFVAKHPFRVTVNATLAAKASETYKQIEKESQEDS